MVIDDLHRLRAGVGPAKTDAELVVDANGMFSASVAFQGLKSISGRHSQRIQPGRGVELVELSPGDSPKVARAGATGSLRVAAVEDVFRARIDERGDHCPTITDNVICDNRT